MTEPKNPPTTGDVVSPPPKKAAYTSPALRVYGTASVLTGSNFGAAADMNAMNPGSKGKS
jgi:hypothetical protein